MLDAIYTEKWQLSLQKGRWPQSRGYALSKDRMLGDREQGTEHEGHELEGKQEGDTEWYGQRQEYTEEGVGLGKVGGQKYARIRLQRVTETAGTV